MGLNFHQSKVPLAQHHPFIIQLELWLRMAALSICKLKSCAHFRSDPHQLPVLYTRLECRRCRDHNVQSITGRAELLLLSPVGFVSELWQIFTKTK